MEDVLGEGAFGEVYKGIVKCPIINPKVKLSGKNPICTPVAIKLLKCKLRFSYINTYVACTSCVTHGVKYCQSLCNDVST